MGATLPGFMEGGVQVKDPEPSAVAAIRISPGVRVRDRGGDAPQADVECCAASGRSTAVRSIAHADASRIPEQKVRDR